MAAEAPSQRRVQQVGGGVVGLGGMAWAAIDVGVNSLAELELAPFENQREHLVVSQSQDVLYPREAVALAAFNVPRVGDLAATGGVEGRLDELCQHAPVLAFERADGGVLVGRGVPDEIGREPGPARERCGLSLQGLGVLTAAGVSAGPRALLFHQAFEAFLVDPEPLLGNELER